MKTVLSFVTSMDVDDYCELRLITYIVERFMFD